jgi:hypothetical protein
MRKPVPIPNVAGATPGERMSNALSMVLTVSKKDLVNEEARLKSERVRKREQKSN